MQLIRPKSVQVFRQSASIWVFLVGLVCCTIGCADRPSTIDVEPEFPFRGLDLKLAVTHQEDLPLVQNWARSWNNRQRAKIQVSNIVQDPDADLILISPAEMPRFAEANQLVPVPDDYFKPTHPLRWDDIFIVNSSRLCVWKNKTFAIPVVGEGLVFAYRTDFFDGKEARPSSPPKTWEEILKLSKTGAKQHFAAWPTDSETQEALFFSLAASFDRLAINRLPSGTMVRDEFFRFQFDLASGSSRLNSPPFLGAGKLLEELSHLVTLGANPAESFNQHGAKFGFVSLKDLSAISPEIAGKLGILPLTGTANTYSEKGELVPVPGGNVNRLVYLGWGGRTGVVTQKCKRPDAAWDFWADASLPDQQSLDLISLSKFGAGAYRSSHLEARVRPRWLEYHLSRTETERLTSALRDNAGFGIQNYRIRLRTPNEEKFRLALQPHLTSIFSGKKSAVGSLEKADAEWKAIIAQTPPEQWREWLRKSLGL